MIRTTFAMPNVPMERKVSEGPNKCACKGNCGTKLCSCQKRGDACGKNCKCDKEKCINKQVKEEGTDGEAGNSTTTVKTENNTSKKHSLDDGQDMDATYNLSVTPKKFK